MTVTTSSKSRVALVGLVASLGLAACGREPGEAAGEARAAARTEARQSARIRWGSGPQEVGYRPKATEIGAEGPSSVAVHGDAVYVLDRLNERVVQIAFQAANPVRIAAAVPRDAEHLAAGPDGSLLAWSPLRATAWLRSPSGEPAGEIAIHRALRDVQAIELLGSHRVRATTMLQEAIDLGSPRAPLDLPAALRTKREGAAFLPDGRGVAVRRTEGRTAELLVYADNHAGARESRTTVALRHRLDGAIDAARIVGSAGAIVCMRIERVTSAPAVEVTREARCIDAETGAAVLRASLPSPGAYTPHEELAVGQSPPSLAAITPEEGGLLVQRWPLPATKVAEVKR